ncbi:MAG: hypothetical protein RJA36_1451 [Pseudomonadota bacterium]|jgi:hypothetical protein
MREVLPEGVTWTEAPRSPALGVAYSIWDALYNMALAEHAQPEGVVIAEGVASLTKMMSRLLPQGGASTDDLVRLDLTSVAQGRIVWLSCPETGQTVTVKNAASVTNDGEIVLRGGADVVLENPYEWLILQRVEDRFFELQPLAAGRLTELHADLNMRGFNVSGGRRKVDRHSDSARTLGIAHRGTKQVNQVSCVYTLPMAQPASGDQWQEGDTIEFRQEAASCSFRTSVGSVPRNIDNHDRGRGVGAYMIAELTKVSPTFQWTLAGQTQASGGGGGSIERTFVTAKSAATINTDAGVTTYKNALSLVHTPPDGSTWIYFAHCGFKSSNSQNNTGAEIRFQRAADSKGPLVGCARYSANQLAMLMMHGASYGSSPGSQSLNLDFHVGNSLYSASVFAPELIGLKLETGEFLSVADGSVNNVTSTSYTDLLTMTQTFAAEEYIFLAWAQVAAADIPGATLALEIDGVLHQERVMGKHTALTGYYSAIVPKSVASGSRSIKIKAKSNGAFNCSITSMGIVALKKSLFQDTMTANSTGEVTSTSTAYADFVTGSKALLSGWNYLVLGDLDTALDGEGVSPACLAQLTRNGSRIGQEYREVPRTATQHTPVAAGFGAIVQKLLETDSFAVQYRSAQATNTITCEEGSVVLLSLKPAA